MTYDAGAETTMKQEPEAPKAKPAATQSEDEEKYIGNDESELSDAIQARILKITDGMEEPYTTASEVAPNVPCYRPGFKKAETLAKQLLEAALATLTGSSYRNTYTERLLRAVAEMQDPKYPEPEKIAFIGDSGVGKSSLINTLLDFPDICPEGASGGACTCVITEYRQPMPSQVAPFRAHIDFFDQCEIKDMLFEHYDHYYTFYVDRPADIEGDELQVLELQANTAYDVFRTLFAAHEEFENEDIARKFLESTSSKDDRIITTLTSWTTEMIAALGGSQANLTYDAQTTEEMRAKIDPLVLPTTNLEDDDGQSISYWPLIRMVRVGLDSPLLQTGLVIADLPGVSDTNNKRRDTTFRYSKSCALQVIVAPIKRVLTDRETHLKLVASLQRSGTTKMLICTMIDDIPLTTKARDVAMNTEAVQAHEGLFSVLKAWTEEIKRMTKFKKGLTGSSRSELSARLDQEAKTMKYLESMVLENLVLMRNDKVKREISIKYRALSDNARYLLMHFVSNRDYQLHLEGYTATRIPLPIKTTGIPELRYRLKSIPAAGKLATLTEHISSVRSVIDSMAIWASQSEYERSKELRKLIEKPRSALIAIITTFTSEQERRLSQCILQPITCATQGAWKDHIIDTSQAWKEMHASTFGAWCRKHGSHKTKRSHSANWNEELMKPLRQPLLEMWERMEAALEGPRKILHENLFALIDNIRNDLGGIAGASTLPIEPFLTSLSTRKDHIFREIHALSVTSKLVCSKSYDMITSCEHSDALMDAMVLIYDKMTHVIGKAKHMQRCEILTNAMEGGEPFAQFCPRVKQMFGAAFADQEKELLRKLNRIFDEMLVDYDSMFVVEELPDTERDALKEKVKIYVKHAYSQLYAMEEELAKAIAGSH